MESSSVCRVLFGYFGILVSGLADSCLYSLQLRGQRGFGVLALEVLLEGFRIRHLGL